MNANEPDVVRKHFGVGKRGSFLAPGDLWPTPLLQPLSSLETSDVYLTLAMKLTLLISWRCY